MGLEGTGKQFGLQMGRWSGASLSRGFPVLLGIKVP